MSARHAAAASAAGAELRRRAAHLPRVALAHLPTPLEEMPRLAAHLGGPRLFIKRDDCTGLAFGGNKTRHNEFLLGEALAQGADLVVWGAGVQSNNCRQTAAACARLGLDIHLVLARGHASTELQGNLLLDHVAGASYEFVDAALGPELDQVMAERAEQFRTAGRTVYVQSRALWGRAAVSYVLAMAELDEQLRERQVEPAAVYVSAAGATGAGLVLGAAHLATPGLVRSVLPIRWPWDEAASIADLANQAAALLDLPPNLTAEQVRVDGGHVGPGYGQASPEGMAALALVARLEGILLDPVYTAKAMAALIADVRAGRYAPDQAGGVRAHRRHPRPVRLPRRHRTPGAASNPRAAGLSRMPRQTTNPGHPQTRRHRPAALAPDRTQRQAGRVRRPLLDSAAAYLNVFAVPSGARRASRRLG